MIEIISILITLISLFIFSNFPLNFFYLEKKYGLINYSFNEVLLLNLIINCNLLLAISFFSINFHYIFFFIVAYVIFFFINFKKQYLFLFQKNIFLCLSFAIFFYAISILVAKNGFLEYDALAHWIFKVKVFFQGGTVSDLKNLVFDYYPHLGSFIWAFFWKNSFLQYEYLGRLFFIYIFLISVFSINSKLNKKFSEIEKILIIFLLSFLSTNIFLFGGYQEYFLFFCFFCFSNFFTKFYNWNEKKTIIFYHEIIILMILNILIWVKQEGLFYFFILTFLYVLHSKKIYKIKFIFLISSIILFFIFLALKNYHFGSLEFNDKIINTETLKNLQLSYLISKILIISKYFLISFIKYPIWLVIILSIIFLNTQSNFLKKNNFFYTYIILTFGFIYAIFLNTPDDLNWLVPVTLNRLVFALSGFLIILCVEMFNRLKLK